MQIQRLVTGGVLLAVLAGCAASRARVPAEEAAAVEPTPRPFALPAPARFVLSNGLQASVVRRPHLPIVTVRVIVRAGDRLDEPGRAGLAEITAALLKRGAGGRTAPALAEAIDATGGTLEVATDDDAATLSLRVLRRDLAKGLGLLADVLTRPALDARELTSLTGERAADLEAALDDGDDVAALAIRRVVLAGHPYGRPPSRKALGALTSPEVQRFYTRWYRPDRAQAFIVGDVEPVEARGMLARALGAWGRPAGKGSGAATARGARPAVPDLPLVRSPGRAPAARSSGDAPEASACGSEQMSGREGPPAAPTRPIVWLVDMNVNQSYVRLGALGPTRRDPDRPTLDVMNFILGGDYTSRLNQEIRDQAGLAYGAGSRYQAMRDGGMFVARLNTRTETTRKAIDRMLAILHAVREQPVTAAELANTRAHLTGAFPMRFETNAQVADELGDAALFGLPDDDVARYRERVRAVDAAAVQAIARRWVPERAWHLVVVGKAKELAPQLAGLGEVRRLSRTSLVE